MAGPLPLHAEQSSSVVSKSFQSALPLFAIATTVRKHLFAIAPKLSKHRDIECTACLNSGDQNSQAGGCARPALCAGLCARTTVRPRSNLEWLRRRFLR